MPPDTKSLPENAGEARLPQGALLGLNDFKKTGYGGPCPPIGRHRYFHKLYALDITLDLKDATKSQIERAMRGHVLADAELIGTYQRVTGSHGRHENTAGQRRLAQHRTGGHDAILYLLCILGFSFCCAEGRYRRRDYSDSHEAHGCSEELRQGFVSRDAILRYLHGRKAPAMRDDPWCDPGRAI